MTETEHAQPSTPLFSNKAYDRLKYVALVLLPAIASMYFGFGEIWGLPNVTEVVGTITVLDTFLGVLLRSSNSTYKKSDERFDGSINKVETEDKTLYSLDINGDPSEVLAAKEELTFKVNKDAVS